MLLKNEASNKTKIIVLLEIFWTGHHPTYFKYFLKTLLECGFQVMAFCPAPEEVNDWLADYFKNIEPMCQVHEYDNPGLRQLPSGRIQSITLTLKRWQTAAKVIKNTIGSIDKTKINVIFPYLDSYLDKHLSKYYIDRIFPYDWTGLYFAPSHFYKAQNRLLSSLNLLQPDSLLKSHHCTSVGILDEGVKEKLQSRIINKPIVVLPDFIDASLPDRNYKISRNLKERAGNRNIIGLFGHLDKRKGFSTLIDAAKKTCSDNYFYIFAGPLCRSSFTEIELAEIDTFVQSEPSNCLFHFEFIPDEASFNALIEACDVIFAAYENFPYSSNLLTKAAYFKKPVIVSNGYCMAQRVRDYQLGIVINAGDVSACIDAVQQLSTESAALNCDFDGYMNCHSVARLEDSLTSLLNMGI
jgi:glycosyltransferase involved in cell wall biosynthesis